MKKTILLLFLIAVVFGYQNKAMYEYNHTPRPYTTSTLQNLIALYHHYISDSRCQFYPSCSRYCYHCMEEYGEYIGTAHCIDRLSRCNKYSKLHYPVVGGFLYDPPKNFALELNTRGGSSSGRVSINKAKSYAEFLIQNEEWELAYEHFLKLEYENHNETLCTLLGACCINLGQYQKAESWLEKADFIESNIYYSFALYKSRKYNKALNIINQRIGFPNSSEGYSHSEKVCSGMRVAIMVRGVDLYEENETFTKDLKDIAMTTHKEKIMKLQKEPSGISSGFMSAVIPGSGQIINGYTGHGISALVYNALTFWFLYKQINDDDVPGQIIGGLAFSSAYIGNIIGGSKAPRRRYFETQNKLLNETELRSGMNKMIPRKELIELIN